MKTSGPTNNELRGIILKLKKSGKYSELVKLLETPRRKRTAVNLVKIEALDAHKIATSEVLGIGEITKPFIIYSWRF